MISRIVVLLVVAFGSAWYLDLLPSWMRGGLSQIGRTAQTVVPQAEPAPMYKWTDADGRLVYGNVPPAGRKAERVSGGTVSVVEMPKLPPPKPAASEAAGQDLNARMIEKSIEAQTR